MMTLDEQIEILMAAKRGEYIERREFTPGDGWGDWLQAGQCLHDQFNFMRYEYRIAKEPEYRPCYGVIEFTPYAYNHRMLVKPKDKEVYFAITRFNDECVTLNSDEVIGYSGLFYGYVWGDDGTPCGVKQD